MSVSKLIAEFCEKYPDADAVDVSRKILEEVDTDALAGVLADEVDGYRRNRVRAVERTAFAQFFRAESRADSSPSTVENLKAVFSQKFAIGNNVEIEWGRATIAQHKTRIAMLTKLRSGIDQTIERHQEAIRLIEAHNATCLDEIEQAA